MEVEGGENEEEKEEEKEGGREIEREDLSAVNNFTAANASCHVP